MQEVLWVAGLVLMIAAYASIGIVPWFDLVELGRSVMLSAAAIGVPLELIYFAALALALRANGNTPRGWYWRSFDHHKLLSKVQRPWVLFPFYTGALSFLVIAFGIAIVLLGFVAAATQYGK
jgi:hypothetical protein